MARFPFASLRVRLLLLVLLAIVPALGLILYTATEQRQDVTIDAQQNALRLARLAASDQEHLIEGTHQLLIALVQLPPSAQPRSGSAAGVSEVNHGGQTHDTA